MDDIDFSQMIQGTMTSLAGNITIPFTGRMSTIGGDYAALMFMS
jgi:hypothetical protein